MRPVQYRVIPQCGGTPRRNVPCRTLRSQLGRNWEYTPGAKGIFSHVVATYVGLKGGVVIYGWRAVDHFEAS